MSDFYNIFKIPYRPYNVGRSGYTSLSLEEKRYARTRRNFDAHIKTDKTFTVWVMDTIDTAIEREGKLNKDFSGIKFIGNKTGGCILEEKNEIIEININKNEITCSRDKGICKHIRFALLHPSLIY